MWWPGGPGRKAGSGAARTLPTRKRIVTHRPTTDQPNTSASKAELPIALAEALATKLCHDLAGALGTLMGALEMAGEDAELQAEAIPLARDAAAVLAARLRLARLAWGSLADDLGAGDIKALAAGLPAGRRIRVDLSGLAPERRFAPDAARLLLNLLILGVESLSGIGELTAIDTPGGEIMLQISGPRAAWPTGFAAQLAEAGTALRSASDPSAREVQGLLTALIAHASGRRVSMLLGAQTSGAPPLIAMLG